MRHTADTPPAAVVRGGEVTGIVQAILPVSDLAISAAWYRDVLGLTYFREFGTGADVTGCALVDIDAGYVIALRLRSATAGDADLRGEHPVIVAVADRATLARIAVRAAERGYEPTSGEHPDAAWVEVVDPDGIALRFAYPKVESPAFVGVRSGGDGDDAFYATPRLTLPAAVAP